MISNHLWRTHFHAAPAIVGKSIAIDGKPLTIIGVLPRRFSFPDLTFEPDVYVAADLDRDTTIAIDKPMIGIRTIVLLRPGINIEQAQAESQTFYLARLHKVPAEFRSFFAGREINLQPLAAPPGGRQPQTTLHPSRLRCRGTAHRLHECRQPATRPRCLAPPRNCVARRSRGFTLPSHPPVSRRKPCPLLARRRPRPCHRLRRHCVRPQHRHTRYVTILVTYLATAATSLRQTEYIDLR